MKWFQQLLSAYVNAWSMYPAMAVVDAWNRSLEDNDGADDYRSKPMGETRQSQAGAQEAPQTPQAEEDVMENPLTKLEEDAIAALADLLKISGADFATEAQWRRHAEGAGKRHPFRIPDIIEKGGVEMITVVRTSPRYGKDPKPQAAFRPR